MKKLNSPPAGIKVLALLAAGALSADCSSANAQYLPVDTVQGYSHNLGGQKDPLLFYPPRNLINSSGTAVATDRNYDANGNQKGNVAVTWSAGGASQLEIWA